MDTAHVAQLLINNQPVVDWRCVYSRNFRPQHPALLDVDELGAGDVVFRSQPPIAFPNSNPHHSYTFNGLLLSIERPANAQGPLGEFAAAEMPHAVALDSFLLVATFNLPSQVPLVPPNNPIEVSPVSGTYAPSILIKTEDGRLMGASCQFSAQGARLNLPHTGAAPNLPWNPLLAYGSIYRLVLMVSRTAAAGVGWAGLFIDNHSNPAESRSFEFSPPLTTSTLINDMQAGIGTANGFEYRASVNLLDFQIWTPPYNSPE
jgi:hypothetical protein